MLEKTYLFDFLLASCLVGGCGLDPSIAAGPSGDGGSSAGGSSSTGGSVHACGYGQTICDGEVAKVCDGQGKFKSTMQCPGQCKDGLGCVSCVPNKSTCSAGRVTLCDASGARETDLACDGPGITGCDADGCRGPCSPTSLGTSNQGCRFWPTVTANSVWADQARRTDSGGFHFGVFLGNPSDTDIASVTITRGTTQVTTLTIDRRKAVPVPLDWIPELKGADWTVPFAPVPLAESVSKPAGAYRIVSDHPIIAYQFNPIESIVGSNTGCPRLGEGCFSYSSDASLLLPEHVLAAKYTATGFRGWHQDASAALGKVNMGDFLAITATESGTTVTVTPRSNQGILGWTGDNPRTILGQPVTISMDRGDVLQLFTPGLTDTDSFSGTTVVEAHDLPIQVLSGVGCATVPVGGAPCSHMEDPVLPEEALGNEYLVPALFTDANLVTPHTIRVQSVSDGTALTFEPADIQQRVTLNRGEVLEIPLVTRDVRISGNNRFAVTQHLNGREPAHATSPADEGGPSQLAVPPRGQYLTSYTFIASPNFDSNFVTVMAPTGAQVRLDGALISLDRFTPVGASGMSVTRAPVLRTDSVHVLRADKPIGAIVYGYGAYSNYMYSAGHGLTQGSLVLR